jgi:hypothetical protein
MCATIVDPDQPAHLCQLIRIRTVYVLVRNNLIYQKSNSADPDQTTRICQLIWIYSVRPCHKGVYMEKRVKCVLHSIVLSITYRICHRHVDKDEIVCLLLLMLGFPSSYLGLVNFQLSLTQHQHTMPVRLGSIPGIPCQVM